MNCQTAQRALDAYSDRELDPEIARLVADHVGTCASCRQRLNDVQTLAHLVGAAPYYSAPERLRVRVATQARRSRRRERLRGWAVAAVLVLCTVPAVYRFAAQRENPMLRDVVAGHVRSLMADHLVDVGSSDQHTVKPWFVDKLDFSPPVADLGGKGYPLVGGRIDYIGDRPVAALVYQRGRHAINVFISSENGSVIAGDTVRSLRGFHVHHWTRDGLSFWAVSDVNEHELDAFVRALRE